MKSWKFSLISEAEYLSSSESSNILKFGFSPQKVDITSGIWEGAISIPSKITHYSFLFFKFLKEESIWINLLGIAIIFDIFFLFFSINL